MSRLLQGVCQQVPIHPARQRKAQGHDQGRVGAMQNMPYLLSRYDHLPGLKLIIYAGHILTEKVLADHIERKNLVIWWATIRD